MNNVIDDDDDDDDVNFDSSFCENQQQPIPKILPAHTKRF